MRYAETGRRFSSPYIPSVLVLMVLAGLCATANAAPSLGQAPIVIRADTPGGEGGGGDQPPGQDAGKPLPGQLIVPGSDKQSTGEQGKKGKQCMTTCAQWGEECMLVNQGAGGMQRRCRRVCKQFTEECF